SAKPATARLGLGLLPNNPSTPGGQIYFGASADKGVSFQPALTRREQRERKKLRDAEEQRREQAIAYSAGGKQ
ncbi:hypothetical protein KTF37_29060, partial [Burkholderia multivorans]|uniref:hypothetical protein n=1 Tax=Burkholderia multivorans TaxID=87883 RepID=UPI001C212466